MSNVQHLLRSKMSGGGKRKYGKLSLQKKIEIIKLAEMGYSQRALASRYNCGKTQIHLLVTQKSMWLDRWERAQNGTRDADESFHYAEEQSPSLNSLNDLLFDFHAKLTSIGIPVSGSMLQERAVQVAKDLHQFDFVPDEDWLLSFASHYEVALSEDDENTLTLLRNISSTIREDVSLQNFDLCDIFNLGEVRLAYKFVLTTESTQPLSTRDYLTVSLCFNAVGGKEAELIVYDGAQHGNVNSGLYSQCVSNWKGRMTQSLYEKRLCQLNAYMSRHDRHILLLVDESKFSGSLECSMSNVKVKPTSAYLQSQPLLCNAGNTFKLLYCRNLLRMLLAHSTTEDNVLDLAENLSLSKAVGLVQSAWDDLHPKTIQNSFFEAGLKHYRSSGEDLNQISESDEALIREIKTLICLVHKKSSGEELSDISFSPLLADNFCGSSTGDCSDSDEEEDAQGISKNSNMIADQKTLHTSAQPFNSPTQQNIAAIPSVSILANEALPSITHLDILSDVIFSKAQIPKVKLLLNELENLFEDAIADYKFKDAVENSI